MKLSETIRIRFPMLLHPKARLEIGDGWEHLITNMMCELVKYSQYIKVTMMKEKFGTLRVGVSYQKDIPDEVGGVDPSVEVVKILERYEEMSYTTCFQCGADSELQNVGGWQLSICDPCKIELEEKRR